MRARPWWFLALLLLSTGLAGCHRHQLITDADGMPRYAPILVENPIFLPQGPDDYNTVFNRVHDAVNDYFDIQYSNIFAGQIETRPQVTAGVWDTVKLNAYSFSELLESSFQTIRRTAFVTIMPAECGGYFVKVQVIKELEDLPQPVHANSGAATLRHENAVERPPTVVDTPYVSRGWILLGQDLELEQLLLKRIREAR